MGTVRRLGMLEVATNSNLQQSEWTRQGGLVITLHPHLALKLLQRACEMTAIKT